MKAFFILFFLSLSLSSIAQPDIKGCVAGKAFNPVHTTILGYSYSIEPYYKSVDDTEYLVGLKVSSVDNDGRNSRCASDIEVDEIKQALTEKFKLKKFEPNPPKDYLATMHTFEVAQIDENYYVQLDYPNLSDFNECHLGRLSTPQFVFEIIDKRLLKKYQIEQEKFKKYLKAKEQDRLNDI